LKALPEVPRDVRFVKKVHPRSSFGREAPMTYLQAPTHLRPSTNQRIAGFKKT